MKKNEFPARVLPDIEMYGGDTSPWEVALVREDNSSLSTGIASECTCTLTFSPFKITTGLGGRASTVKPLLTKEGTVGEGSDGGAVATFTFDKQDTIGLRGKFLYQIEVVHDSDLRIAQGHVYIKQNTNR